MSRDLVTVLLFFFLLELAATADDNNLNLLRLQKEKKKTAAKDEVKRRCQNLGSCPELPAHCLSCNFNSSCVYGEEVETECKPLPGVICDVSMTI